MTSPATLAGPRRFRLRALLTLAALALSAACEYPTKVPQLEQTWVVPVDSTRLAVSELLPPELTVAAGAFRFTPPPVTVVRSLGAMCGCASSATPVPKPAFTATLPGAIAIGPDVLSATTTAGNTFRVNLSHNFNFDPLRPSAAAGSQRGWFVIELRSGGAVIGRDSINGANVAWPAGITLTRDVPISAGVALAAGSSIPVDATINSPAGDPVAINTSQALTVVAAPAALGVTGVRVRVANKMVNAASIPLDVQGISADMTRNVVSGGFLFTIGNPFAIAGTMTMTIAIPGQPSITKSVPVSAAPSSTASVDFTGAELESILGKSGVTLALTGTVSGPPGGVVVTPTQVLGFASRVRMTIRVGG